LHTQRLQRAAAARDRSGQLGPAHGAPLAQLVQRYDGVAVIVAAEQIVGEAQLGIREEVRTGWASTCAPGSPRASLGSHMRLLIGGPVVYWWSA